MEISEAGRKLHENENIYANENERDLRIFQSKPVALQCP